MSGLTLGAVALAGFEIPGEVRFGGAQAMVVHKLPGGARIIDVMGRDDADVTWAGVISGGDASGRARLLDAIRIAGDTVPLSWDAFYYAVIIADLQLNYTNPWWIPYRITCKIVADQAQMVADAAVTDAAAIVDDLALAAGLTNVSAAAASVGIAGALTAGTQANASAIIAVGAASTAIVQGIQGAEDQLGGSVIAGLVVASATLAHLTAAQGYVSRAYTNLKNVDN